MSRQSGAQARTESGKTERLWRDNIGQTIEIKPIEIKPIVLKPIPVQVMEVMEPIIDKPTPWRPFRPWC